MQIGMALLGFLTLAATASTQSPAPAVKNSENTQKLADGATSPPANITDVAWLAGYWIGEGLGGVSIETWSPPQGDRMYGTFTLTKEAGVVFSEAMLLVEEKGSLLLKVKHFNPDFTGWEEKDDFVSFPLVGMGDNEAFFSGLTFRRNGDALSVFLVLSSGGERTEHAFRFQRGRL